MRGREVLLNELRHKLGTIAELADEVAVLRHRVQTLEARIQVRDEIMTEKQAEKVEAALADQAGPASS